LSLAFLIVSEGRLIVLADALSDLSYMRGICRHRSRRRLKIWRLPRQGGADKLACMSEISREQPCPHCGRFANRGVSIDAVVVRGHEVLLIQRARDPDKGSWATPGGYIEWDESAEEAVARELQEETGLILSHADLITVRSEPDRHPKQVINLVYGVTVEDGDIRAGDDAADVAWFDLDQLPETMALDHRNNIAVAVRSLKAR
jgi:8-oxo-dGTP diphosphatase